MAEKMSRVIPLSQEIFDTPRPSLCSWAAIGYTELRRLNAACLDFSVAEKGYLTACRWSTAYRWSGESELSEKNLVSVPV
jgi:hypothetical protein